ncbi:undecaprenyl-diphosphatase [Ruminococcus sp. YE71]|uniref:undecaprenyl-diphosphate phosphatase n=1 Tax=unclassified Ruminococcus TaxID=2608920 RepID=UPI00088EA829|nr:MULTISPECIES: undecaprenyl-diphosphate phosphatase [unclassified Ruminococcus]SDA24242.1 undecaprenyl-diphosphatase [Ruminococcus sp. YE78]SFW41677.1 undecaprenyl-diphosphatase [Ruminococcus sp. YE71]
MIEFIKVILLGIVEGITEWLPVSSTGHLILANQFIGLKATEEFQEMFDVVIQLGAIMAVVVLYWNQLFPFGRKNNDHPLGQDGWKAYIKTDIFQMWFKCLVACVPAAVIGLLFDDMFNKMFYNWQTIAIMLILFGIIFIIAERYNKKRKPVFNSIAQMPYCVALMIGAFQLIAAVFPGTSRSGATIVGALIIGVSRTVAAEFTFFLAVPVMFGASLLKLVKFFLHSGHMTGTETAELLLGMGVAFGVSIFVIRFMMSYIKKHDFTVFGWYRIVLGVLVLLYFGLVAA